MPTGSPASARTPSDRATLQWTVFLVPIALALAFGSLYAFSPDRYLSLIKEDGPVEYGQALAFFLSATIGFAAASALRGSPHGTVLWLLVLFGCASLFIAFEEISWGQRLLGYETPKGIEWRNRQREMNVHNLRVVERYGVKYAYILVGFYGSLAWIAVRKACLRPADPRRFLVPDWYCSLYFLPVACFYLYFAYSVPSNSWYILWPAVPAWRHQEACEFLLGLGILLVAIRNYRMALQLHADASLHRSISRSSLFS